METVTNYLSNQTLDFTKSFYTMKFAEGVNGSSWNMHFPYRCARLRALVDNYKGSNRYSTFYISKENPNVRSFNEADITGRKRTINAPVGELKELCSLMSDELTDWTKGLVWMKGFNAEENVKTNAVAHKKAQHLINIDLKDFFHQFKRKDIERFSEGVFNWNKHTARKFARLVTFENKLVQGNPVSPALTNIATTHLDIRIQKFCKKLNLNYTRYADDITISSNCEKIKSKVIKFLLVNIIKDEGFSVNPNKIIVSKNQMEATGMTIQDGKVAPKKTKIRNKLRLFRHLKSLGIQETNRLSKLGLPISIDAMIQGYMSWLNMEFWEPKPLRASVSHYKKLWKIRAKRKAKESERRILMCQSGMLSGKVRIKKWEQIKDNTKIFDCKYILCERHGTTGCDSNCKYFNKAEALRIPKVQSV